MFRVGICFCCKCIKLRERSEPGAKKRKSDEPGTPQSLPMKSEKEIPEDILKIANMNYPSFDVAHVALAEKAREGGYKLVKGNFLKTDKYTGRTFWCSGKDATGKRCGFTATFRLQDDDQYRLSDHQSLEKTHTCEGPRFTREECDKYIAHMIQKYNLDEQKQPCAHLAKLESLNPAAFASASASQISSKLAQHPPYASVGSSGLEPASPLLQNNSSPPISESRSNNNIPLFHPFPSMSLPGGPVAVSLGENIAYPSMFSMQNMDVGSQPNRGLNAPSVLPPERRMNGGGNVMDLVWIPVSTGQQPPSIQQQQLQQQPQQMQQQQQTPQYVGFDSNNSNYDMMQMPYSEMMENMDIFAGTPREPMTPSVQGSEPQQLDHYGNRPVHLAAYNPASSISAPTPASASSAAAENEKAFITPSYASSRSGGSETASPVNTSSPQNSKNRNTNLPISLPFSSMRLPSGPVAVSFGGEPRIGRLFLGILFMEEGSRPEA